jgi:hypothetical protein
MRGGKSVFRATCAVRSVCDITPSLLQEMNVQGLLLDIDNTLTTHNNPVPAQGVEAWVACMKASGIRLRLVSNNHAPRVEPFSALLAVPCICEGRKPLCDGFRRAQEDMKLEKSQLCVVGDQIFTDILGANCFGVKSIYVPPMELETTAFFKLKRFLEKPFLPKKYITEA